MWVFYINSIEWSHTYLVPVVDFPWINITLCTQSMIAAIYTIGYSLYIAVDLLLLFFLHYLLYLFILLSEYSYSPTDRDRPVHGNSWENQTASWHTLVRRICLLGKGGRIRIQNKEKKWSTTIHIPFFSRQERFKYIIM